MFDTREKLIEEIQLAVKGCATYWAALIADRLIANGVTMQEWIPAKEPPKEDGEYLVYRQLYSCICREVVSFVVDGAKIDQYSSLRRPKENVWYTYDSEYGYVPVYGVTHWMPLPEGPKEVN